MAGIRTVSTLAAKRAKFAAATTNLVSGEFDRQLMLRWALVNMHPASAQTRQARSELTAYI
jgi:hypothetical protein